MGVGLDALSTASRYRGVVKLAAGAVFFVAALVALGWLFDVQVLAGLHPALAAGCLLVLGAAIWRIATTLERSNDRLRVLARVSGVFAQVATDYDALLDEVTRSIADLVGDGCQIALLADDGHRLHIAANAHRDPEIGRAYRSLVANLSLTIDGSTVIAEVTRTGRSVRANVAPATIVERSEQSIKPIAAKLNVYSYAVVPIRVRQTVIGALTLLRSAPGHGYNDDDVTLMQDLADRAGLAIDNARLYGQLEQRVRERTAALEASNAQLEATNAQLEATNAQLEAANEQLEAFNSSAAHDLRTPLRGISGFSDLLLDEHAERLDDEGRDYLNHIRDAAQRMWRLIEDLLNLSRVTRAELHREPVDLSELARVVVSRLHAAEPQRDVDVVIADGMVAQADPRLVEIAFTNLLDNAWKFTSKRQHARIELSIDAGSPAATYTIRDNGAGFDPAHADKLFGVFQRLHTTREFQGTGIGLATVQRIIRRHGGKIWAEGAVGRGATFHFTLGNSPGTLPPASS